MIRALTPLDFLARSAVTYADKTAVVEGAARASYAEFNTRVHRLASALRGVGVVPGDRIAVLAWNSGLALDAHFAVPLLGAWLVMLNVRLQPAEVVRILNHSGARILFAEPDLAAPLWPHRNELLALEHIIEDHEAFRATGTAPLNDVPDIGENDPISINYTSGTTGDPKGVLYTHRGSYLNAVGEIVEHGLTESSVYLWTLPMFHCNGWCFPWAVTAAGARHVLMARAEPGAVLELIERERITHLCGAPTVVNSLIQLCSAKGVRLPQAVRIITAAAPPPPAVIRAAEEIGAEVTHVYGLTETYGPHSISAWRHEWNTLPAVDRARLKARQGVAYTVFGTDLRVVDSAMNDVPADGATMGEVVMRGNNVMLGYYRDPKATDEAFRGDWFHSGDIGVVHPDGYIELRDRAKDIIISGGENVSSIEVERVLQEHPAVLEAAVVGAPDEKWGEVPQAYVTLKPGVSLESDELIRFCRTRLAHFKCPKTIIFGALPKTATGKVRKTELRAAVSAAAAVRGSHHE